MRYVTLTLSILCLLASFSPLQAKTITFADPTAYWNIYTPSNNDQKKDVMGVPDILGGSFTFTGNLLTAITLEYKYPVNQTSGGISSWQAFAPGDWFFGSSADSWNYVLTSAAWKEITLKGNENISSNNLEKVRKNENWDIFDFRDKGGLQYNNATSYIMAGKSLYPNGWSGRTGHPALANLGQSSDVGDVKFTGWLNGTPVFTTTYSSTWTFPQGLALGAYGDAFYYGFSLTCANDVLYGQASIPTPEPGTLLLLGAGVLGLAAVGRSRGRRN